MPSFTIPDKIRSFLGFIETRGYRAYLVGGCVRDGLLGLNPHDWDVCTNAMPQELQVLFPNALTYGIRHGTVTIHWLGQLIEVTTFRAEGKYSDHRRPDQVVFVDDLYTDLSRRDFTVNAIAMDADGNLYDPYRGIQDLRDSIIRAVGDAETRFQEDALRMFRAIRFSAQLDFEIESKTKQAMIKCAPLASFLAVERVAKEVEKTLLTEHPESVSDMISSGLLEHWISEPAHDNFKLLNYLAPERIRRWCSFALQLHQPELLYSLRLDRKTISACNACFSVRKQDRRDVLFWKQTINRYGKEIAEIAAEVVSALDGTEDINIIRTVIQNGECCTISDLAVRGDDLKALGLQGSMIGAALKKSLRHVWQHPEQNERESLLAYLEEEFFHG